jgi:UDP-N-acetylmuramate dehydrogenase
VIALAIRDAVPLAPLTTFELGGPARHFVDVASEPELVAAIAWADERALPLFVIGGGSNLVVSDAGYAGLVVRSTERGVRIRDGVLTAKAAEPWDELVALAVRENLAGLECLSGIPGSTGATPIQNVGAYGQEVSETIAEVRVFDRVERRVRTLTPAECGFSYRDSALKRDPDRFVVLEVSFTLVPNGRPTVRYPELVRAIGDRTSLAEVRDVVIALRRAKSMVIDAADPNRRSAGSFFTNPIVPDAEADRVVAEAVRSGLVPSARDVPRYAGGEGKSKLAAGWLIERAGFAKGLRRGAVGISSKHALALVHHGGGTTAELLSLAREIRDGVHARFGVTLTPEPTLLGVSY